MPGLCAEPARPGRRPGPRPGRSLRGGGPATPTSSWSPGRRSPSAASTPARSSRPHRPADHDQAGPRHQGRTVPQRRRCFLTRPQAGHRRGPPSSPTQGARLGGRPWTARVKTGPRHPGGPVIPDRDGSFRAVGNPLARLPRHHARRVQRMPGALLVRDPQRAAFHHQDDRRSSTEPLDPPAPRRSALPAPSAPNLSMTRSSHTRRTAAAANSQARFSPRRSELDRNRRASGPDDRCRRYPAKPGRSRTLGG